jgi:hypothetical protein
VAFAAIMVEEKERGVLHLGPVGSLEGAMLLCAFFASWMAPPARALWMAPVVAGMPAYGAAVVAGGVLLLATVYGCLRRLRRPEPHLLLFMIASLTLAVGLARGPLPLWLAIACLVVYSAGHSGGVIGSHLLRRPQPWPDPVAPLAALAPIAFPRLAVWWGGGLLAYLVLRAALGAAAVLRPLRSQWRWTNPVASLRSGLT